MAKDVRIGTCGFRSTKLLYAESLSSVEIQNTFYQPPQIKTLEAWRAAMPKNFEFTLKAWQLITHHPESPTYKRLSAKSAARDLSDAGSFRWTPIVREAWETTKECASALQARTVLFQCPARFTPTKENLRNVNKFFAKADRGDLNFAWEPRGDWPEEVVRKICTENDLWHAVDPFKTISVTPDRSYYRLHGRVRWRYQYEDGELEELATMMSGKLNYVFFNNVTMFDDAVRFEQIMKSNR
jgi:uncharacterized protein YecE (DUF72 family)